MRKMWSALFSLSYPTCINEHVYADVVVHMCHVTVSTLYSAYRSCAYSICALFVLGVTLVSNSSCVHCTCPKQIWVLWMWQCSAIIVWTSLRAGHMFFILRLPLCPLATPHAVPACGSKPLHILKETQCPSSPLPSLSFFSAGGSNECSLSPCLDKKEKGPIFRILSVLLDTLLSSLPRFRLQRCVSAPHSSQEPNPCTSQQNVTS